MSAPPPQWDTNPLTPIQHKYLIEQVRKAKKIKFGQWFLKPVDPVALNIPTYPEIIKNPMDLGTLEEKLKKHEYDNASAFMADFDLIIDNCLRFNGPTHSVAQMAINLRAYFNKNIKSNPGPFVDGNGMPIIRRKSGPDPDGPAGDRPKRAIHPPKRDLPHSGSKPKKKKHQVELKFCEQIVSKLFNKKHATFAYPFLHPVDPVALNIPNYHKIIKKPMDFTTIQANLKSSQYANAKEFLLDARQVFLNCYKFNPTTDNVYRMGKQTEELFDSLWKEKDQYVLDNTPASEPPSDAEDEDEEEDEDEDEENGTNEKAFEAAKSSRILELQQQIAKLSQEVVTLATSSYSPKASAKKIKTKPPKTKRASVAAAPLKPAKTKAKTTKVRKLTLDQKREVSEGIANLDEGQMRRAVQIIRNGVPHLRDVHDDELELDIDEIPDVVVLELYDFVRKLRPRGAVQEPDDDEYTEPDTVHKPASVNRKKNKPMKAVEQEERIQKLEAQLNKFKNTSGSEQSPAERTNRPSLPLPQPTAPNADSSPADNQDDSSGDEGAESESSEEE
ncbi:Bromodomain-containing protein [Tothia fuscella]|uniref:Bromodomain-containing protein n=1 Tax=Tothia fuscella TaxID=1048955 RepID=A0A9P4NWV9_9PEZI|nr:Bromodomain-containing protein [Tothia fuscella]